MDVQVIFGTPSRNCQGLGICHVIPTHLARPDFACPQVGATLNRTPAGHLRLTFERSSLLPACIERYFKAGVFQLEEAYHFPKRLVSPLGFDFFTVFPGIYAVQESTEHFAIDF